MDIQDIKPYPNNAKQHPDSQLEALAKVIAEVGWQVPIILDKNNVIISGHGRMMTFKKYGEQYKLPTPWVRSSTGETLLGEQNKKPLTEQQVKMWRLADNRLNESDFDMELVIEELKGLDNELAELTGFELDLSDNENVTGNKEIDVNFMASELNCECPRCGFKFNND